MPATTMRAELVTLAEADSAPVLLDRRRVELEEFLGSRPLTLASGSVAG